MGISDPAFYPARGGSAEALRQNIWRTRIDLEEALSEMLRRFNMRDQLRRRLRGAGARRTRRRLARYASLAAAAAIGVAVTPPSRRRWVIAGLAGTAGLAAGAAVVARRRPALAPDAGDQALAGVDQRPDVAAVSPAGDVVDLLIAQHRRVEATFAHVLWARGKERFDAFAALVELLNLHEHAEREVVHPALVSLGGDAAQVARDRLEEEGAADLLMGRLISIGVNDPAFTRECAALRDTVREHAAREEGEEFPRLRDRLPGVQLRSMANQVRAAQSEPW